MITVATRPDLLDATAVAAEEALATHFAGRRQPAYRVRQVMAWLYERLALSFEEMTDLPRAEREALAEAFTLTAPETAKLSRSRDGTAKHLWRLADGELIESV
ncbi:MAG TPA: hypothetical protein VFZ18_09520, partial [Longimicrobiaceae bacterium]